MENNFSEIANNGMKRFIDKYIKKRKFDKCVNCDKFSLLINIFDHDEENQICESCYDKLMKIEVRL